MKNLSLTYTASELFGPQPAFDKEKERSQTSVKLAKAARKRGARRDPVSGLYVARLDRSATRVLCGRPPLTCDGLLGLISTDSEPEAIAYDGTAGVAIRYAVYPGGWAPEKDGVWRLSNHAARLEKRGWGPILRKYRVRSEPGFQLGDLILHEAVELPAKAICPKCMLLNVLLPDELDLDFS